MDPHGSRKGHGALDCHGTYEKPNGDRMVLPLRSQMLYAGVKGWTSVGVEDIEHVRGHLGPSKAARRGNGAGHRGVDARGGVRGAGVTPVAKSTTAEDDGVRRAQ